MDRSARLRSSMVVAIGLIGGLALASLQRPVNAPPLTADAELQQRLVSSFAMHRSLLPYAIDVVAERGAVQLEGSVDEPLDRALAERLASSIDGVRSVENRLVVAPEQARRQRPPLASGAEALNDRMLAGLLRAQMSWDRVTRGLAIGVDSWHGHVSLYGNVSGMREREAAGRIAERTAGVRSVYNLITLEEPAPSRFGSFGRAVRDAWISTKVKTALMYASQLSGLNLRVSTDRGVVALDGTVASRAELDLALEIAAGVRGVRKVDAAHVRVGGRIDSRSTGGQGNGRTRT